MPAFLRSSQLAERSSFEREIGALLGRATGRSYELSEQDLQRRIDTYFEDVHARYTLPDGTEVKAQPHFRITSGFSGPEKCKKLATKDARVACIKKNIAAVIASHDKKALTSWMKRAIHVAAYGRGSPTGIQKITQLLIDAGKLDDVIKKHAGLSSSDAVRMLQWEFGYGMDCAGYVQRAFLFARGEPDDGAAVRAKYGFEKLGNENLYELASKKRKSGGKAFKKVPFEQAAPGDLLIMDPPKGQRAGHTVLVRSRASSGSEHTLEVDASWGAGSLGNLAKGGVHRRKFVYDDVKQKWGDVAGDGSITWNAIGPYDDHPVIGLFRVR
jgi:cell wall-associated NlpC family hydrolase